MPLAQPYAPGEDGLSLGVTFRSIIIGLVLIPLNAWWLALSEIMWYSGEPTSLSLFYNVVFLVFLLVLANLLLKRFRPAWALAPAEILVVYTMLSIASALAGHDFIEILIPTMSHIYRYNPLEQRYNEMLQYLPDYLLVKDEAALQSAYIGQESIYDPRNYGPWLKPLAWWFLFIMALCAVMWGLILVFRKQWTENEKLSYPIIQLPVALAQETKGLLANRLFWLAFAIAGFVDAMNGLHVLFPLLPQIPIVQILNLQALFTTRPWLDMGPAWVSFYPFAIGLCFFMPLDLAFSSWFFFLFWKAQRILASHIGIHGMPGFPYVEEQTAGGYYAIALIALWISRHHLKRFFSIFIGHERGDVGRWERQEVYTAVGLIAVGFGFLMWFCSHAQMMLPASFLFLLLYFLLSVSITRMRAELGPPSHDLHNIGPNLQLVKFFGAPNLSNPETGSPHTLVMLGILNFFNRAYRGHPMPHGMEGFRIAERLKLSNARYLVAMGVSIVVGIICAFWAVLWVFNRYGAAAQVIGPGEWFGREMWETKAHIWFTNPEKHLYEPTYAILIGTIFALGLAALRMSINWWPFHPVGYAVSGSWAMEQLWLCVFTAWLVKLLLLKYGGAKAYRPAVPFFMGLIMGDFIIGCFWNIYGIVMETKVYHFWPY